MLANGSAFLRVDPPEQSPDDLYISSAQVRRCELVSGDRVSGPVRTPRRSERYASLLRIETINGAPADEVAAGTRYEDLPADWPSERLALAASDPTLEAIEWLTPFGRGSRVVIAGGRFAGKSEVLRQIAVALQAQPELTLGVALVGVRPEEVTQWQDGPLETEAALNFAASADTQAQALERVLETARRTAARGGHAVVLIDTLDGLAPAAARKALAAARNLRDGGSLTVIATATAPFGRGDDRDRARPPCRFGRASADRGPDRQRHAATRTCWSARTAPRRAITRGARRLRARGPEGWARAAGRRPGSRRARAPARSVPPAGRCRRRRAARRRSCRPEGSKWTASSPSLTRWSSHAPRNTSRRSQCTSERSAGPTRSGQHSLTWSPSAEAGSRISPLTARLTRSSSSSSSSRSRTKPSLIAACSQRSEKSTSLKVKRSSPYSSTKCSPES